MVVMSIAYSRASHAWLVLFVASMNCSPEGWSSSARNLIVSLSDRSRLIVAEVLLV